MKKQLKKVLYKLGLDYQAFKFSNYISNIKFFNLLSRKKSRNLMAFGQRENILTIYNNKVANSLLYRATEFFYVGKQPSIIKKDLMEVLRIQPYRAEAHDLLLRTMESMGESGAPLYFNHLENCINKKIHSSHILRSMAIALTQRGRNKEAIKIVNLHIDLFGLKGVKNCIPLIPILKDLKVLTSSEIDERKLLHQELTRKNYLFEFQAILKSQSTGVVGNSPKELGRGNGSKIDKHEHIIRFNNFEVSGCFSNDYGEKTSIWVHSGVKDVLFRDLNFDYIVYANDITLRNHSDQQIQELLIYCHKSKVVVIPESYFLKLKKKYDILFLSTGMKIVYLKGLHTKDSRNLLQNLFGFSFKDQVATKRHYYKTSNKSKLEGSSHEWDIESEIYHKITTGNINEKL